MRNEVMRRTKSNQIKIRNTQGVKWQARAEVLQQRQVGDATTQASSNKELKGMQADVIQNVLKEELTEWVKSKATKSNIGSMPQKAQSKATRNLLLEQIKREKVQADAGDYDQVLIQDIAAHVQKDLRKGWTNGILPPLN